MRTHRGTEPSVAYFTMEVGLESGLPTYSGGLGVLAGDILKAAADLGVPMVGVSLLHRKGYFRQQLNEEGKQTESPERWSPSRTLIPVKPRVIVRFEGREVKLRAWCYRIRGVLGHEVPVYFLDANVPGNRPEDRALTDHLYGGDDDYRLAQEILLGYGGLALLRALKHRNIETFHMNEGHCAFLTLALLEETAGRPLKAKPRRADVEKVCERCVFTTHTPVPAGHDRFPLNRIAAVMGEERARYLEAAGCVTRGLMNTTLLALRHARYANGVSSLHREVSRKMFRGQAIQGITNGVHAGTWTCAPMQRLFDRKLPGWREDNRYLREAVNLPLGGLQKAREAARKRLFAEVRKRTGEILDPKGADPWVSPAAPRPTSGPRCSSPTSSVWPPWPGARGPCRSSMPEKPIPATRAGKARSCASSRPARLWPAGYPWSTSKTTTWIWG